MDAELLKIRKLNHEPENFSNGPTIPDEDFMNSAIMELNRNLAELRRDSRNSVDSRVYVDYLKKNIYIILLIFNKMNVSPTYFFNEILNLVANRTCAKDEISDDDMIKIAGERLANNPHRRSIENYFASKITYRTEGKVIKSLSEIHRIANELSKEKKYNPVMDDISNTLLSIIKPDDVFSLLDVFNILSRVYSKEEVREFCGILASNISDCEKITILEIKKVFGKAKAESDYNQISRDILDVISREVAEREENYEVTVSDVYSTINELTSSEIPNAVRIGLDKNNKKFYLPTDKENISDIGLAYDKVVSMFKKVGISPENKLQQASDSLEELMIYQNAIMNDLAKYTLVYTHVEDLTRLLLEYLCILALVGENPKKALNKYIKDESKILHPLNDTLKTLKKINYMDHENGAYRYSMLVLAMTSWTLKAITTGMPDVSVPIPLEAIDTLTVFSSMEVLITHIDERFKSSIIAVLSAIASPFILLHNLIKEVKLKKEYEENRELEKIRAIERAKKRIIEKETIKELDTEQVDFARDITGISEKELRNTQGLTTKERVSDNLNILKASDKVRKLRDKILAIDDDYVREGFVVRFNAKLDFLNADLASKSGTITTAKFYAYVKSQISVLNWQVNEYYEMMEAAKSQTHGRVKTYDEK